MSSPKEDVWPRGARTENDTGHRGGTQSDCRMPGFRRRNPGFNTGAFDFVLDLAAVFASRAAITKGHRLGASATDVLAPSSGGQSPPSRCGQAWLPLGALTEGLPWGLPPCLWSAVFRLRGTSLYSVRPPKSPSYKVGTPVLLDEGPQTTSLDDLCKERVSLQGHTRRSWGFGIWR